jgi:hypothetical protein
MLTSPTPLVCDIAVTADEVDNKPVAETPTTHDSHSSSLPHLNTDMHINSTPGVTETISEPSMTSTDLSSSITASTHVSSISPGLLPTDAAEWSGFRLEVAQKAKGPADAPLPPISNTHMKYTSVVHLPLSFKFSLFTLSTDVPWTGTPDLICEEPSSCEEPSGQEPKKCRMNSTLSVKSGKSRASGSTKGRMATSGKSRKKGAGNSGASKRLPSFGNEYYPNSGGTS